MTKQMDKEEAMKQLDREYEAYLRFAGPRFDWAEALLTVLITVIDVGGFSLNLTHLIEMVVEHKFVSSRAALDIFCATVLLGQWVYHLAKTLMWKFK